MQVAHVFVKNAFDEVWAFLQPFAGQDLADIHVFTLGERAMRPVTRGGL
jgi:hypothetical protein